MPVVEAAESVGVGCSKRASYLSRRARILCGAAVLCVASHNMMLNTDNLCQYAKYWAVSGRCWQMCCVVLRTLHTQMQDTIIDSTVCSVKEVYSVNGIDYTLTILRNVLSFQPVPFSVAQSSFPAYTWRVSGETMQLT